MASRLVYKMPPSLEIDTQETAEREHFQKSSNEEPYCTDSFGSGPVGR